MNRGRVWWSAGIAFAVVLFGAVLAIPAVVLSLPNQYQGSATEAPPELYLRQALYLVSAPMATAAFVLLVALVVIGVARRSPAPAGPREGPTENDWAEAVLVTQVRPPATPGRDRG